MALWGYENIFGLKSTLSNSSIISWDFFGTCKASQIQSLKRIRHKNISRISAEFWPFGGMRIFSGYKSTLSNSSSISWDLFGTCKASQIQSLKRIRHKNISRISAEIWLFGGMRIFSGYKSTLSNSSSISWDLFGTCKASQIQSLKRIQHKNISRISAEIWPFG